MEPHDKKMRMMDKMKSYIALRRKVGFRTIHDPSGKCECEACLIKLLTWFTNK